MLFKWVNSFNGFKSLFEPIRIDLDKVSAQTIDSEPKSQHLRELGQWATGVGDHSPRLKEVPSRIAPRKQGDG